MDRLTENWDQIVVDRSETLSGWAPVVKDLPDRDIQVFGVFNNHFAGHAPDSLREFSQMRSPLNAPPGQ